MISHARPMLGIATAMDRHSTPLPDDHAANLTAVVQTHGNRWKVGQEPDTGVWFAIEWPSTTALHVVVDHTLAGLAAKLDAEGTSLMTIEVVLCTHPGCVDLRDVWYPGDGVLHLKTPLSGPTSSPRRMP